MNIIFLHHSTGNNIWNGTKRTFFIKAITRVSKKLAQKLTKDPQLPIFMNNYNSENNTNYKITEQAFPKRAPYGWNNYPYDYYNIWVKNAGSEPFMEEPTLEILAKEYQVIIFKHCYPASNIKADLDSADINSPEKTLANYKLQYNALKEKMHQFPDTKFVLFTGAVQVKYYLSEEEALRAKQFHNWIINEWSEADDNIFLWDLYALQTEGGLYFKDDYALTPHNSHPGGNFSIKTSKLFFNRTIDIIENNGNNTKLTGESLN
ncbi:hypothetical protein [Carboxylicivirga sp. N1Y90]|uniref:hypothetical protein n=1 Tax=Carboxylicivirga fragile TaxID=3417571 RepID=UPI003D329CC3|nr:hypothetical protein [Marinilabiliaceae bacterium N1Y90]